MPGYDIINGLAVFTVPMFLIGIGIIVIAGKFLGK